MKTKTLLGVAAAMALNFTAVNAQVLGGNVAGGLGGSLGGMRDVSAVGHGSGHGAFGADLDSGTLRRSTRGVADRTTRRAGSTVNAAADRSRSSLASARHATKGAVAAGSEQALTSVNSARAGGEWGANAAANAGHDVLASAPKVQGAAAAAGSATSQVQPTGTDMPQVADAPAPRKDAAIGGSLAKSVGGSAATDSSRVPLTTSGEAGAYGDAAASRDGVSARGSADSSASAGIQR